MNKTFFIFFTILIMQQLLQFVSPGNIRAQTPTPTPFAVRERMISGKTTRQSELMRQALALFQEVMNDEQFRRELRRLKRVDDNAVIKKIERFKKYKVGTGDDNRSQTTDQIVTRILNGTEYFDPRDNNNQIIIDYEADIFCRIYTKPRCWRNRAGRTVCSKVRGGTQRRPAADGVIRDIDFPINTRSWFMESVTSGRQNIFNLVEHLAHEWSHKFGFIDTGVSNTFQLFPYVFGRLVERTAKRIEKNRNRPAN